MYAFSIHIKGSPKISSNHKNKNVYIFILYTLCSNIRVLLHCSIVKIYSIKHGALQNRYKH